MSKIDDMVIDNLNQMKDLGMDIQSGWRTALTAAQVNLKSVAKDSTNSYHKYAYASAEDIIAAARVALNKERLSLMRVSYDIRVTEIGVFLHSNFMLNHILTGVEFTSVFPIIEDKGRPFDKALCGALTSSLSYFLRDLLQIPRQDEPEATDKRDDTKHSVNTAIGLRGAVALRKKIKDSGKEQEALMTAMKSVGLDPSDDMATWSREWLPRIERYLNLPIYTPAPAQPAQERDHNEAQ